MGSGNSSRPCTCKELLMGHAAAAWGLNPSKDALSACLHMCVCVCMSRVCLCNSAVHATNLALFVDMSVLASFIIFSTTQSVAGGPGANWMAWTYEDPSSFAVKTYLQSASVLPVFCRVDAIRTVPGNHAIELTASRRLPQQAWVSLRWPDMYPESCVRQVTGAPS